MKTKLIFLLSILVLLAPSLRAAQTKTLAPGHVPGVVTRGQVAPLGRMAATNRLHLAIGLPLRNREGLTNFLRDLYNPASAGFHHYLKPAEFVARFGPTAGDYAAVQAFAASNHLTVSATAGNRMLLNVTGAAGDVERAFHVRLKTYRHPREKRVFFAPDIEPSVDARLPVQDVSGLNDYVLPHPCLLVRTNRPVGMPQDGSAPDGSYLGADFRQAYVPGCPLRGEGQTVGLFQLDGYDPADITNYASLAGLTNLPLQNVLLDNFSGAPGINNNEVCLDIEMCLSMAPGLAGIIVYEGYYPNDVLNRMAMDDAANQLSSSWTWGGGPTATTDQIFEQMAAQGQSYFTASGDYCAYAPGTVDDPYQGYTPVDNPYVTCVGGTTLQTTGPGGDRIAETAWNWGGGYGSGGGYSSYYNLPSWQGGIDLAAVGGSPTTRNLPDVALTADNVYVTFNSGSAGHFGGTSCATPLWAAFTALVNEQATQLGQPAVGFLNPAIYNLARGSNYATLFNDITTGNNTNASSPNNFFARTGYDLCTGWGTPNGTNLINALAIPGWLGVETANLVATGSVGRAFAPTNWVLTLTNTGAANVDWAAGSIPGWAMVSPTGGTLGPASSVSLNFGLANASLLPPGNYMTALVITNLNQSQVLVAANLALTVNPTLAPLASTGYLGGAFSPANWTLSLTNPAATDMNWVATALPPWLTLAPAAGTVPANGSVSLNLRLADAIRLPPDSFYQTLLMLTNLTGNSLALAVDVTLSVGQSIVQNGGFETGNFTGWTLAGDTVISNLIYNVVATDGDFPGIVHSGNYGAFLGEFGYLATLTQTLTTTPGQRYLVSCWLDNPQIGSGQNFTGRWDGTNYVSLTSPPAFAWTNLTWVAVATTSSTVLQFGVQNDANYFGFDDVSVRPVPPVEFSGWTRQSNAVQLAWYSLPKLNYQVQTATNLTTPVWTSLGTLTAVTNVSTLLDAAGLDTNSARFYRLLLLP